MVKPAIRQENVTKGKICFVLSQIKNVIVTARTRTHIPMAKSAFLVSFFSISSDSYLDLPYNFKKDFLMSHLIDNVI